VVECLPSKNEALDSNPSTKKRKEEEEKEEEEKEEGGGGGGGLEESRFFCLGNLLYGTHYALLTLYHSSQCSSIRPGQHHFPQYEFLRKKEANYISC
jgi:hypothetical protein